MELVTLPCLHFPGFSRVLDLQIKEIYVVASMSKNNYIMVFLVESVYLEIIKNIFIILVVFWLRYFKLIHGLSDCSFST